MCEISANDIEKSIQILQDLTEKTNESINHVSSLINKVEDKQISTEKGVSFLEMKNQLMLNYMIDLSLLMSRKTKGLSIQEDPSIARLIEGRTVLEKIKPIDQKLKYQVDKLIKTAAAGGLGENDPLRFKPNPGALESKLDNESSSDDDEYAYRTKSKVYKPPKVAPAYYDGDLTVEGRKQKAYQRIEKKIRSSRIIKDLQAEMYDGPEEIKDDANLHKANIDRMEAEKIRYEEENFIRRMETKKERNMGRQFRTVNQMRDVTEFGDISELTGEASFGDEEFGARRKKKGGGVKRKGGKGGKKGSFKKKKKF